VLATTFGSSVNLTALVPAALLTAPGTVPVSVVDPVTGLLERDRRDRRQPARDQRHLACRGSAGNAGDHRRRRFRPHRRRQPGQDRRRHGRGGERDANRLTATVSLAAQSGAVTVTTARGTASGPTFTVRHEQDFQIVASPAELITAPGGAASLMVQLASTGVKPFTGLAQLSVAGLPAGVTANFSSPSLGAGKTASLSLAVPATLAAGTYNARIDGVATIDGATHEKRRFQAQGDGPWRGQRRGRTLRRHAGSRHRRHHRPRRGRRGRPARVWP
jgi:hypothetical protein